MLLEVLLQTKRHPLRLCKSVSSSILLHSWFLNYVTLSPVVVLLLQLTFIVKILSAILLTKSLCHILSLQQYLNLGIKHRVPEELCTRKTRNGDSLKMHYRYRSLKHISRAPPLSPLPFILFTNLSILKDINNMIVLAHILIVAAHSGPTAKSSTPLTIGISFDNRY